MILQAFSRPDSHRVDDLDQRLERERLCTQQGCSCRQGAGRAPRRLIPTPAARRSGGMKSIQSRATSPMLRPVKLLKTSTSSVDQAEAGTLRQVV